MDAFETLLLKHRNSRFLVIDPEGGYGDELILMGLEKKLRKMNIHYRLLRIRKSPFANKALAALLDYSPRLQRAIHTVRSGFLERYLRQPIGPVDEKATMAVGEAQVILFRGGSYLNDIWKGYAALNLVSKFTLHRPRALVIIASHSFYFNRMQLPKNFAQIEAEMHVFCREKESYKLLRSLRRPRNLHVYLSPDTALYLTRKDFHEQVKRGSYVLIAPRLDRESLVNWRIRQLRNRCTRTIVKDINLLPSFMSFIDITAKAARVYTDRLHVAILAAILRKEIYLLPNSYHKNKSTYEFSLKRFHNVHFIDTNEFPLPISLNISPIRIILSRTRYRADGLSSKRAIEAS
jgi:exopolysaccharide biosynthesis predicted pyruvyltransferase EpsI